jgi:uncharacterized protein YhbP (UPF0306 family)
MPHDQSPDPLVEAQVQQYLQSHNVLCLATSAADCPWVSPVFYSVYNEQLIFLSAPHTRHSTNISNNPTVSGSVQNDYGNWEDIKGIQLQGQVKQVTDTAPVIEAYAKKFPVTGDDAPPQIARALDKIGWYAITVELLYFIDNSKGLGHRIELDPARVIQAP